MKQKINNGYGTAYCMLAVTSAACRSLVRGKKISVVAPVKDGPQIMVSCLRDETGTFMYGKKNSNGVLISATAAFSDEAGVDISFGDGFCGEIHELPPKTLSFLLSILMEESKGRGIRIILSAEEPITSFEDLSEYYPQQDKKTFAVLLGKPDCSVLSSLSALYGEENVKSKNGELNAIWELAKSSVVNVLFAGTLKDVAKFLGIPYKEAGHLLGYFEEGKSGFFFATSSLVLDDVRNQETLGILQQLSKNQIKAGILITQR